MRRHPIDRSENVLAVGISVFIQHLDAPDASPRSAADHAFSVVLGSGDSSHNRTVPGGVAFGHARSIHARAGQAGADAIGAAGDVEVPMGRYAAIDDGDIDIDRSVIFFVDV